MNHFGKNLKFLMKQLAQSQASIEKVVEKRQTTISNWINGKSSPDAEDLVKLSSYFGLAMDDLCLTDLSSGNLITEEYLKNFRQFGNPKHHLFGNPIAENHQNIGEERSHFKGMSEREDDVVWLLLHIVRQMDSKLDWIRERLESQTS